MSDTAVLTGNQLAVLGALLVLLIPWRVGYDHGWRAGTALAAVSVVFCALLFWAGLLWILNIYGVFALAFVGYWVGRAIINQAHSDIRPDESDIRRRLYTLVQIAVFVGIVWLIGWFAGIDWLADDY